MVEARVLAEMVAAGVAVVATEVGAGAAAVTEVARGAVATAAAAKAEEATAAGVMEVVAMVAQRAGSATPTAEHDQTA